MSTIDKADVWISFRLVGVILAFQVCLGIGLGQDSTSVSAHVNSESAITPFIVKSAWLKFGVYDGRIMAKDIRRTQSRSLTLYHDEQEAKEHLVVRTIPGKYRLKYSLIAPEETLELEYDINGVFSIRRKIGEDSVQLRQNGTDPIKVVVARSGVYTEYSAQRLWLVLLSMSELDRQAAITLMERLCPRTHVSLLLDESLAGLRRLALRPTQLDITNVRLLVGMLDDESFNVRQQADRQLRSLGRPLVGLLEHVDYAELSTEQRIRLRLIAKHFQVVQRDSVDTIVATLKWNPQFWQMMARLETDQLMVVNAQRQLQQLTVGDAGGQDSETLMASEPILLRLR